jgi:hypothetical protein
LGEFRKLERLPVTDKTASCYFVQWFTIPISVESADLCCQQCPLLLPLYLSTDGLKGVVFVVVTKFTTFTATQSISAMNMPLLVSFSYPL